MVLDHLDLTPGEILEDTGWEIKPEGACRDDICVPLADGAVRNDGIVDGQAFAAAMGMPLASDEKHRLWALGPRAGGHVLSTAVAPEIILDEFSGNAFDVASLRGRKVLLLAWASW